MAAERHEVHNVHEVHDVSGRPIGFVESFRSVVRGLPAVQWWAHVLTGGGDSKRLRFASNTKDDAVRSVVDHNAAEVADDAWMEAFAERCEQAS